MVGLFSCVEYTPKPLGYFRIEPPLPFYVDSLPAELPYSFSVSTLSVVELIEKEWINISYPSLNATIYCSYIPVDKTSLTAVIAETKELLLRQIKNKHYSISGQTFNNPDKKIYATMYIVDGDCPSPVQFTLTDSIQRFFRGALYYNCTLNTDSLEPVTRYLIDDISELIQTFCWNN